MDVSATPSITGERVLFDWRQQLVALVPICVLSFSLQQIIAGVTGFAREYSLAIIMLLGVGGGAISMLTHSVWELLERGPMRQYSDAGKRVIRAVVTLLFVSMALVLIERAYSLRSQCIYRLDVPREWWVAHFGPERYDDLEAAREALEEDPALIRRLVRVPRFLNLKDGSIFLPTRLSPAMVTSLQRQGCASSLGVAAMSDEEALSTGIRISLDTEPFRLIDWANEPEGQRQLSSLWRRLFYSELLIIIAASVAWGLMNRVRDFLVEMIGCLLKLRC